MNEKLLKARQVLVEKLKPKVFYTKKTIEDIIFSEIDFPPRGVDISKLLQTLRKEGLLKFDRKNGFWHVLTSPATKECSGECSCKSDPISIDNEIITSLQKIVKKMAEEIIVQLLIEKDEDFIIQAIQKIASGEFKQIRQTIIEYISDKSSEIISERLHPDKFKSLLGKQYSDIQTQITLVNARCEKLERLFKGLQDWSKSSL